MSARRGSRAVPRALHVCLLAAAACSAAPPPASAPARVGVPSEARPTTLGPARWALFDHLGTRFDEAGRGAESPRPEPVIADGVRMVVDAGMIVASARHADQLSGFRSLPERLGGGFVLWSEDRVYRAKDFLGELSPIADVGAVGGVRPWMTTILLRTPVGLLELDPRVPGSLHRAALPGVADALALDARRAVRLDALGRASYTLDGGASWTDVLATRGARVRALGEGPAGEIVLTTEGSRELVLGAEGTLSAAPEPLSPPPAEPHPTEPPLPRPTSSRVLPDEILPLAVARGVLLPGSRIAVAREHGVRVLATATGLPVGDGDLVGVDERFARCEAVALGSPPAGLLCAGDSGGALLYLDGPISRPQLEATFPSAGGFFAGPRGRLAFDGPCGPDPPASTDLGPGNARRVDSPDEGSSVPVPAPAPDPTPPPPPDPEDARTCVRVGRSRWIEHRLPAADARRLYRWVPGDGGAVTAIVLTGGDVGDAGAEEDAGPSPGVATTDDGLRVIRIDPDDAALAGGAFPAVAAPHADESHRTADTAFWQDDDGAIRGWIHLPPEGDEKLSAPPQAQGAAQRPLPVISALGGRMAGVRIDAAGHVTVLPLPKGVVSVVTGGAFALAMADTQPEDAPDGGAARAPAGRVWFETTDGGASWAPIEAPPVGALDTPGDPRDSFGCSPIGCALPSGIVRIGWGSKPPPPAAELALTAAASPRPREPAPLHLACRIDADALPSAAPRPPRGPSPPRAKPPPKPQPKGKRPPPGPKGAAPSRAPTRAPAAAEPAPIALRLPVDRDLGVFRDRTWTGDVLPPFQPGASPRHISAAFPSAEPAVGSKIPILDAGPGGLVDLLLFRELNGVKRALRAGGGSPAFVPFDVHVHPDIAADGPGGSLVLLDASHGDVWVSRGPAISATLRLLRVTDVSRTRLTLARRIDGGALALAGYSTTSGEIFAGALDLGRAEVGPLAALGRLFDPAEAGACPRATHRLLVELPVLLQVTGRTGQVLFEAQLTASALIVAGAGEKVCVEAVEAAIGPQSSVLRATLGAGGIASVWSGGTAARGVCSAAKRP